MSQEMKKEALFSEIAGAASGGMKQVGKGLKAFARRKVVRSKAGFRRGEEWAQNKLPSERRAATLDMRKQVTAHGKTQRLKDFTRKAMIYGGAGLGAAAIGGGAYAAHRYAKKKREAEEQAAYPTL